MNKGKYCHKYWQLEDANLRYCRDKGQHLKSRSGFQSTGSSPVSGTIFLISEQFFCSEIFTFQGGLR